MIPYATGHTFNSSKSKLFFQVQEDVSRITKGEDFRAGNTPLSTGRVCGPAVGALLPHLTDALLPYSVPVANMMHEEACIQTWNSRKLCHPSN